MNSSCEILWLFLLESLNDFPHPMNFFLIMYDRLSELCGREIVSNLRGLRSTSQKRKISGIACGSVRASQHSPLIQKYVKKLRVNL
jgi:hypothetical protein